MIETDQPIYNGQRAREVLENPAFQWAIQEIKREVTEQWQQSPARDSEGREKLWQLLQMANKLELTLTGLMETGQLKELDRLHQRNLAEKLTDGISSYFNSY